MPKNNGFTPFKDEQGKKGLKDRKRLYSVKRFNSGLAKGNLSLTGFTLIEILIALTILGIGLISVLAYLPIALEASKKAADMTTAALIAQKYIEEIKSASINDITFADAYDTSGVFAADSDYAGFSCMIAVSNPGTSDTKDLSITVRWSFKGKDYIETFRTMIVKYNPG